MDRHLKILSEQGNALASRFGFSSWTPTETQMAGALRFLIFRQREHADVQLVGIVGGSSSGKSTIFNNLIGGNHVSHVTMKARTTRGPVLAASYGLEAQVRTWFDHDRVLFPTSRPNYDQVDAPVEGHSEQIAAVFVEFRGADRLMLVDTPDFSTQRSLDEGDTAMRLMPWFDRVLIVVDSQRWYDQKTFVKLLKCLDRFGSDRLVLFNCNEDGRDLLEEDIRKLADQAKLFKADYELIEYRAGRGFLRFPPGVLDKTRTWLAPPLESSGGNRLRRLQRQISEAANHVLNQNENRLRLFHKLENELKKVAARAVPDEQYVLSILLSPEERKLISPFWQKVDSVALDARRAWDWFQKKMPKIPFLDMRSTVDCQPETYDRQAEGQKTFEHKRDLAINDMLIIVRDSLFYKEIGSPKDLKLDAVTNTMSATEDARLLVADWSEVVTAFKDAHKEILSVLVKVTKTEGIQAGGFTAICAALAITTGGVSVPAAIIFGLFGSAAAIRLEQCISNIRELSKSAAQVRLTEAVKKFRRELNKQIDESMQRLLDRLESFVLKPESELCIALKAIAETDAAQLPVDSSSNSAGVSP
ncbi:MAG: 50S ribosome-binding GTPase [Planctomycetes bacterium]|nr:50S ribosome-binding GTPase [Planctomycetota bacterium]